jgi:hypothetical protein
MANFSLSFVVSQRGSSVIALTAEIVGCDLRLPVEVPEHFLYVDIWSGCWCWC